MGKGTGDRVEDPCCCGLISVEVVFKDEVLHTDAFGDEGGVGLGRQRVQV